MNFWTQTRKLPSFCSKHLTLYCLANTLDTLALSGRNLVHLSLLSLNFAWGFINKEKLVCSGIWVPLRPSITSPSYMTICSKYELCARLLLHCKVEMKCFALSRQYCMLTYQPVKEPCVDSRSSLNTEFLRYCKP